MPSPPTNSPSSSPGTETNQTAREGDGHIGASDARSGTSGALANVDGEPWPDLSHTTDGPSAAYFTIQGRDAERRQRNPAYDAARTISRRNKSLSPRPETESLSRMRSHGSVEGQRSGTASLPGRAANQPSNESEQPAMSRSSRTSPTRPALGPRQRSSQTVVLPRWQPDEEVTNCPVCDTLFNFWYRKHHCRKCGRVVCSSCSLHRITMPRQFIVRPPETAASAAVTAVSDAVSAASSASLGAEIVRMCNPCVPDPNWAPPPQLDAGSAHAIGPQTELSSTATTTPLPSFYLQPPGSSHNPNASHAIHVPRQSHQPRRSSHQPTLEPSTTTRRHDRSRSNSHTLPQRYQGLRAPLQSAATASAQRGLLSSSLGPLTSHSAPHRGHSHVLAARPRRPPIKEEDECPVCGQELPPKGEDGDEAPRVRHVEECIRLYSAPSASATPRAAANPALTGPAAPPPPPPPATRPVQPSSSTSAPAPTTAVPAAPASAGEPLPAPSPDAAPSSSPSVRGRVGNRMLVYRATEKDCVGALDDGTVGPQECVICFEEFSEGEEMGRLECLCKFHRVSLPSFFFCSSSLPYPFFLPSSRLVLVSAVCGRLACVRGTMQSSAKG